MTAEEKLLESLTLRMNLVGGVCVSVDEGAPAIDWRAFQRLIERYGKFRLVRVDFGDHSPNLDSATDALLQAYGIEDVLDEAIPALRFRHCLDDIVRLKKGAPVLVMSGLSRFDSRAGESALVAIRSSLTLMGDQAHAIFVCQSSAIRQRIFRRSRRAMAGVVVNHAIA